MRSIIPIYQFCPARRRFSRVTTCVLCSFGHVSLLPQRTPKSMDISIWPSWNRSSAWQTIFIPLLANPFRSFKHYFYFLLGHFLSELGLRTAHGPIAPLL